MQETAMNRFCQHEPAVATKSLPHSSKSVEQLILVGTGDGHNPPRKDNIIGILLRQFENRSATVCWIVAGRLTLRDFERARRKVDSRNPRPLGSELSREAASTAT